MTWAPGSQLSRMRIQDKKELAMAGSIGNSEPSQEGTESGMPPPLLALGAFWGFLQGTLVVICNPRENKRDPEIPPPLWLGIRMEHGRLFAERQEIGQGGHR